MRYRVTFRKRFAPDGEGSDAPQSFLDLADGVVQDVIFVERFGPDSLHTGDTMEEDDDFLSLGSEIWEYEVTNGREQEFKDAVLNSGMAMEIENMEDLPAPMSH